MGLITVSCTTDTDEINASSQKIENKTISNSVSDPHATDDGVLPPIKPITDQ